jgi:hypothetical protein
LNCRHRDFQSRALPAELSRPAGPAGRPRPSASEKVPRVALRRQGAAGRECRRSGVSIPPSVRPARFAPGERGPAGSGLSAEPIVRGPDVLGNAANLAIRRVSTLRASDSDRVTRSPGRRSGRPGRGRRSGSPGAREARHRQRGASRSGRAQSSPTSSASTVDASGVSPLSARSRLIRSAIGGWVEKSPFERSSNFLIGFVK